MAKDRKHADQVTGFVWQDLGHNCFSLNFKMLKIEVYWDGPAKAYRYEIHGYRKLVSKSTYASLHMAQIASMRKLQEMVIREQGRIAETLSEFVPF